MINLTQEILGDTNISFEDASTHFYQVEQLSFLWILLSFIVLGNVLVLLALYLSKGRKSRMNFFIKHLAFADLGVGILSVLTDIVWKITISWNAGVFACKLIRFLQAVVTYASTYVLVALSIDRYDAITHPMNFSGSWKRSRSLIVCAWTLSFLFASPILLFYQTTDTEDYGIQCWIDFSEKWMWKLYMTLVSLSLFIIPALLIGGCYSIIVLTIWKKSKDLLSSPEKSVGKKRKRKKRPENSKEVEEIESRRASSRGLIPKAKVKTVKMTFVIIFVFILCWSPYIIFDMLQVYDCIPDTRTSRAVATFIQSLAPLNSAANPLIYCLFSTNVGQCMNNLMGRKHPNIRASTGKSSSSIREGRKASKGTSFSLWSGNTTTTTNNTTTTNMTNNPTSLNVY